MSISIGDGRVARRPEAYMERSIADHVFPRSGFFISAPLGHTLLKILQKLFQGKIGVRWQIAMIVVSNLVISPLQNAIYRT